MVPVAGNTSAAAGTGLVGSLAAGSLVVDNPAAVRKALGYRALESRIAVVVVSRSLRILEGRRQLGQRRSALEAVGKGSLVVGLRVLSVVSIRVGCLHLSGLIRRTYGFDMALVLSQVVAGSQGRDVAALSLRFFVRCAGGS